MLVFPVLSLVHNLSVQAVALLLHEHLFVRALDPPLTITEVGLKTPNPLLNLPALSHQASPQAPAPTPALLQAQPGW